MGDKANWLNVLILIGAVQGFFLAFLLWQKEHTNRQAVRRLICLVALVAFLMLCRVSYRPVFFHQFAEIIMLPDAILFLAGPLIFEFTRALLRLPIGSLKRRFAHYLPAVLHITVLNTLIGLNLNGTWSFLTGKQILWLAWLIEGGAIGSLSVYFWRSRQHLLAYGQSLDTGLRPPSVLRFLGMFFNTGFVMTAAWAVSFLKNRVIGQVDYVSYYVFWAFLVAYIFWLGYQVLLHSSILDLPALRKAAAVQPSEVEKLERFMRENKPYLDANLSMADLAAALDMPKHELSRVINSTFGRNFFDYVNGYRIQEFVLIHNDPGSAHLSLLGLAYQAGFNSKSAFNRAFRKEKGESPSTFLKRQVDSHDEA